MSSVAVQFLVNAGPGSAAGERAERIAEQVDGDAVVTYRTTSRSADIARMARSIVENDPEVVYAVDLAAAAIGAWCVDGARRKLIVDTGDTPLAFLQLIGAPWPKTKLAAALERIGYGKADRTIVRGRYHAEQLHAAGYHDVVVVPDGVDLDLLTPHDVGDLKRRLGLDRRMTVGVQGNFTWYPRLGGGLGWELVEAISRHDLDVDAVFIGDGPGLAELRKLAFDRGVADRVHVIGRVAYEELSKYLSLCDVALLTQTDDPSSWARTTGKLPTYLAAGRYVLASRVGTAADLLDPEHLIEYRGRWDVNYPDRLAGRLQELSIDVNETREKGLSLRALAADFAYDEIANRCANEIHRLVRPSHQVDQLRTGSR